MTPEQDGFKPPENNRNIEIFSLTGRILYLTQDAELVKRQLDGEDIPTPQASDLAFGVSTDELAPNRICLQYTGNETDLLGSHLLTGFRGSVVKPGDIMNGNFEVIVAGSSFGRGSSRYHAPIALKEAGIKVIVTEPERIFEENAVNAGIHILPPNEYPSSQLISSGEIPERLLLRHLSPVSKDIMTAGSLIRYLSLLEQGKFEYPVPQQKERRMTMIEKMIARRTHTGNERVGVSFVKPGDECIVKPDMYYGYELQTTVVRRALTEEFEDEVVVRKPEKALLFNDHTALLKSDAIATQQAEQAKFAAEHNIVNFENDPQQGAPAICHTKMLEDYAEPGQLILGNDSHTCTLGVVNTLAVGKGAADLAGALAFDKMVVKVPETIRVNLHGKLKNGATMKDFMLQFGSLPEVKGDATTKGIASGRVLEFGGDALHEIPIEEQLKLSNMAVELQAFTGIVEPNTQTFLFLNKQREMRIDEFTQKMIISDSSASYAYEYFCDLSDVEPTVATPGDTQNGVPLSEVTKQKIAIQKAYIGSCTHGTVEDLKQAAEVFRKIDPGDYGGRKGFVDFVPPPPKVAPGVKLFIQASSQGNLHNAEEQGYIQTLLDAGAELLPIGCGACMNAGPGSTEEGEVGIFATNRNYPGRTGKGDTYLANAAVVAASAIKGYICGPDDLKMAA